MTSDRSRVPNIRILRLRRNEAIESAVQFTDSFVSASEQVFATLLRPHSFPRGHLLFNAGARANAVYFVVEGEVGLLRYPPKRKITNPKLKTPNSKSWTRNPKPQTQNLGPETQNPEP
jgi:CRP-like cAMP-binding protein